MESPALGSSGACAWIDNVSKYTGCVQHSGAEKDHELVLQNVVQEKAKYFRAVRRLFAQTLGLTTESKTSPPMRNCTRCRLANAYEASLRDNPRLDQNGDGGITAKEFEAVSWQCCCNHILCQTDYHSKVALEDPALMHVFDALEARPASACCPFRTQLLYHRRSVPTMRGTCSRSSIQSFGCNFGNYGSSSCDVITQASAASLSPLVFPSPCFAHSLKPPRGDPMPSSPNKPIYLSPKPQSI